ncbi:MAG: methylenetetrahydrofolate--tRNA-(uracil(54)-C(5))-methyltransferase (FADH(2)-oxidizing) TrmFO [Acidobacteria bacterium]|nr:methylenetetrahydrofolate--tRNA-(uracil(54)-C(5))-methyltransferase (FADH(2)-oxidizing) TrmFO [Acidobacteriota bacterium]
MKQIQIIGGGLAGCEAALFLADHGFSVTLFDMKPEKHTEVHKTDTLGELVCSNSFRSDSLANAVGLLKAEMRMLGSTVMEAADATKIPAGSALAVDRVKFSDYLTGKIKQHPNIEFISKEITEFEPDQPETYTILSSGPLITAGLADFLKKITGERYLNFYDAIAPIISRDSIDESKTFMASRYGKGGADYLNCPMSRETYLNFHRELIEAETAELHGFENDKKLFEGCLPVEEIARRDTDALRFGPLKPVGLRHPKTDAEFYAVVQLRKEDREGHYFNLVGFQTHLKQGEQRRVFRLIPGLENARFERYGSMHRNTFINAPELLNSDFSMKKHENLFVAGQLSGVEGYLESAASGMIAAVSILLRESGVDKPVFPEHTMLGGLSRHISVPRGNFQPSNAIFAMVPAPETRIRGGRRARREYLSTRALNALKEYLKNNPLLRQ